MLPKIENLNGEQTEELVTALANAFDDYTKMEMMLSYKLDVALPSIVGKDDIPKVSFEVVKHFKTKGKITELIEGAVKQNPTNPLLKAFYEKLLPKTQPEKRYFEPSVPIEQIEPKHFFNFKRTQIFNPFYFEREEDVEIRTLLAEGKHILVMGNSLAGKTRALFEALKKITKKQPKTFVLFPKNETLDVPIDVPLQEGYHHIAFIEDIDEYYKTEKKLHYDKMLNALAEKGVQIIMTCRTGPEYYEYRTASHDKTRELFATVGIGKVEWDDLKGYEHEIEQDETDGFDGNIGSLFLKLEKMRKRYDLLEQDKSEEGKTVLWILKALVAFYFTSNSVGKSSYDIEKIKDFCLRKLVDKFASKHKKPANQMEAKFQKVKLAQFADATKAFEARFEDALSTLESDEYHLNFLENEGQQLKIEETYLEKIVQPHYDGRKILKDLQDLYDAEGEMDEARFFAKTKRHNILLRALPTYEEAVKSFKKMAKLSIKPNTETYAILIEKCNDLATAQTWYKELTDKKLPETPLLLVEMIHKSTQFEQASRYVEKCLALLEKEKGLYEELASVVLPMLHTSEQVEEYVYLFAHTQARINVRTFNNMIKHLKEKMDTTRCLGWLGVLGIKPDKITVVVLLQKADFLENALKLFNDPTIASIRLDSNLVGHILQKATTLQEGLAVLEQERFSKFVDTSVLNHLLQKAITLQEGLDLLEQERFSKFVDVSILSRLLEKATNTNTSDLENLVAKIPDKSLFTSQNERFWVNFSGRTSLYDDLNNFPIFWENASRFPAFSFLQKDFKSFEEVYAYAKEHQYKTFRYMHNHLLFVLMTKRLLRNNAQKEQYLGFMWESVRTALGDESYQKHKDNYLYPDIQAMLDAYTFPA